MKICMLRAHQVTTSPCLCVKIFAVTHVRNLEMVSKRPLKSRGESGQRRHGRVRRKLVYLVFKVFLIDPSSFAKTRQVLFTGGIELRQSHDDFTQRTNAIKRRTRDLAYLVEADPVKHVLWPHMVLGEGRDSIEHSPWLATDSLLCTFTCPQRDGLL